MADEVTAKQPKGVRSTSEPPPGTRMARHRAGQTALYPSHPRRGREPVEQPKAKAEPKAEAPAAKATRGTPKRR